MEELKRAYEILGVSEGAEKDEIEKRYFILLKRHQTKMKTATEAERAEEERQFAPINEAYRQLIDHLKQQSLESNPVYIAEQKKNPVRRRIEEFLFVNKIPVIGGLIALVFVISFIYSIVTKEEELPSDLSTMMVGAFYSEDIATLETRMADLVDGWERVAITFNYTPNESMDSFDYAYLQKSMVLIATERPHMYILDTWQFDRLGDQSFYLSLDPWEEELRELVGEERLIYAKFEEDDVEHLYGVDLADSSIFADDLVRVQGENAIIYTIRADMEEPELAMKLIQAIGQTLTD